MMGRVFATLTVLAIVALGMPSGVASAAPLPDLNCGQVLNTNVRLREDLTCPNGVWVDSFPNPMSFTIDLGGHTLTTPNPCEYGGCTVNSYGEASLTVEHGTINGGVALDLSAEYALGGGLFGVQVKGFLFTIGRGEQIRNSVIDGHVEADGQGTTFDHDIINGSMIFEDGFEGTNVNLTHNFITGSVQWAHFFSAPDATGIVSNNIICCSAGSGIDLDASAASRIVISHNLLINNTADGLAVQSDLYPDGGTVILTGNVAIGNGGHGLDIGPTPPDSATDGGRNVAIANKTSPQCIGVACAP
jgi:hypothetical protein